MVKHSHIPINTKDTKFSLNIQKLHININRQSELEVSLVKSERTFRSLLTSENLSNYKHELEHLHKCIQIQLKICRYLNKRNHRKAIFNLQMKYAKETRNFEIAMEVVFNHLDMCEMRDNLF